jgi:hypothetical protein
LTRVRKRLALQQLLRRQHLCFGTSEARKLSTWSNRSCSRSAACTVEVGPHTSSFAAALHAHTPAHIAFFCDPCSSSFSSSCVASGSCCARGECSSGGGAVAAAAAAAAGGGASADLAAANAHSAQVCGLRMCSHSWGAPRWCTAHARQWRASRLCEHTPY